MDNPYSEDKLAILISRRNDEQRYEEEQRRQALQSALDSARAASSAKSQFLSNMSHDIRTPMNAIVGMTAIATAHLDDRDRVVECLRKISLSSQHLLSLINDVLDMSKIESGKLSLREEPFNFAELVADAVELVRPQANAGHLNLEIQFTMLKKRKSNRRSSPYPSGLHQYPEQCSEIYAGGRKRSGGGQTGKQYAQGIRELYFPV